MLQKIINSKSKTFLMFCFFFIFGIFSFSFVEFVGEKIYYFYVLIFVCLFCLIIFWEKRKIKFILFCGLFFIFGAVRLLVAIPKENPDIISFYNGEKVVFVGSIISEPELNIKNVHYVIEVENLISPLNKKVVHKVLVKNSLYPEYFFGDHLKIKCTLKAPKNSLNSRFRYDRYLASKNIFSICNYPKISLLEKNKKKSLKGNILFLKNIIANKIDELWAEPESGFMAGLLYGKRHGLDEELTENFNRVGLTHIIAVSGYNISILAVVIMFVLIGVGISRQKAFWIAVLGIIFFVIFVGSEASAVRAGIMGIIILLAQKLGRASSLLNTLIFSAVIMLILNPWLLIWDAGFQLSFLAVLGLMYLSPILEKIISPHLLRFNIPYFVMEILLATFSAIIITLPLILFQFGRLSLVAPIANVLVLWIIPWLMLLGFFAVILSFIFNPLGQFVAWIAGIGLRYVIILSNLLGSKSWSAIDFFIPWWVMILIYILIISFVYKLKKRKYYEIKN